MSAVNLQQELSPEPAFDPYSPAIRNDPVASLANFARTCPVDRNNQQLLSKLPQASVRKQILH